MTEYTWQCYFNRHSFTTNGEYRDCPICGHPAAPVIEFRNHISEKGKIIPFAGNTDWDIEANRWLLKHSDNNFAPGAALLLEEDYHRKEQRAHLRRIIQGWVKVYLSPLLLGGELSEDKINVLCEAILKGR